MVKKIPLVRSPCFGLSARKSSWPVPVYDEQRMVSPSPTRDRFRGTENRELCVSACVHGPKKGSEQRTIETN